MSKGRWDWKSMAEHKRTIKTEIQSDIDKLKQAMDLIQQVNETYTEAFENNLGTTTPSLNVSIGSVAMKLDVTYHELGWVASALNAFKEKV